jgi:DnaK suppressor protein
MFVSLLQLMGFSHPKPVHSRAEENPLSHIAPVATQASSVKMVGAVAPAKKAQAKPARRSPVKAQAVKPKPTPKDVAVVPLTANAGKTVALGKKTVHNALPTQPVTQTTKATPPKTTAPKVALKAHAEHTPQPTAPTSKPAPVKKPTAKPVPATVPTPAAVSKPVLPPTKKKPEKVTTSPAIAPKAVETPAAAKPVTKSTGPELQMTPSGVPVRTGRPSSRLAQLTVPSMAQSVASTAAKSSFTQMTMAQPIVPPLASATKRDSALVNNWKTKPVAELTDAEIIAMSDDEYMNDTQLAYFRLKLVVLKTDILNNAGATTEHMREDTVVVPDPADRATIEEEHALELRTRDRERKLLKKIEQSIGRIDAGDYGYCDETGEPIGVGRLLARPTATLSLEAQQRRELKQKMFGD